MKNTRLVYSTDPKDQVRCEKCNVLKEDCKCITQEQVTGQYTVKFRIEKNGRGGKTVTVMDGFPKNEDFLKGLCKEMKAKCGVGGTHTISENGGTIEIQGDKRDQLKRILEQKQIKFKGM
ncbi:translation initiation factor [Bdellovibrio reynosensis]|uniref:Translation initiation factor n=1 Tax=Bdellovibrio reynosensis TaxID=2835041 RepID=A0ABY4C5Y9_9BACT|nr:translation initiation factor [Bdellovibrio reynosensis]UOF00214.1 translation initiation factor [Bdellovibrio reynosensis]